jgi:hypothetical protein
MADQTIVELGLDDAAFRRDLEKSAREEEKRQKAAARRVPPDPAVVEKIQRAVAARRKRLTPRERAEEDAGPAGPTALESLAGGRVGIGAFAISRAQEFGKRIFFPGIGQPGERGTAARERFGKFTQATANLAAKAAAIENVVAVGLPVLSTLIESGVRESAGQTPGLKQVADFVANTLKQITDTVQQFKAEISGTLKTIGEATTLAKGFAITGQDFGKLPHLLLRLRGVNIREAKHELDMTEATLREGTNNVGEFIRKKTAEMIQDVFSKGSQR